MAVGVELAWLGAVEIARRVNAAELDPQAVVREHLARIDRLNGRLNAYIDVDHAALAGATGPSEPRRATRSKA